MRHVRSRRLLSIVALLGILASGRGDATELIRMINLEVPPFIQNEGGKATGPAVILAMELAKAAGISPTVTILPQTRINDELQGSNRIAIAMVRTAAREPNFTWIGEVHLDSLVFATVKPNPPIDTFDAAKSAGKIGALLQSVPAAILEKNGFQDLELVPAEVLNARKLNAGRISAWFTSAAVAKSVWKTETLDPSVLALGRPIVALPFWIFATKDIPAEVIDKMKARYQEMRENGEYNRIFGLL